MAEPAQTGDFTTVRRFYFLGEADVARSVLEMAGIEAFVVNDSAAYYYANGGIRLQVPAEDAERARRVLDQQDGFEPLPDDFSPLEEPPITARSLPAKPRLLLVFMAGGCSALVAVGLLALFSFASGGVLHVKVGGLLLLFLLGGAIGLILRTIKEKARQGGSVS